MKQDYESTIAEKGRAGVHSLIRSQRLISHIHEYIKNELISHGVNPVKIYPAVNHTEPEITMSGFLKTKSQDITILPELAKKEIINEGVLLGETDVVGKEISQRSISINVRSQLSSLGKNFDTLFERTFAETLNLHLRLPKLVMGEVYMVPLVAYDPDKIDKHEIGWKEKLPVKYVPAFKELNGRKSFDSDHHKYERLSLLIVDFRHDVPKVITSSKEILENHSLNPSFEEKFSLSGIDIANFVPDILQVYKERHGSLDPLRD